MECKICSRRIVGKNFIWILALVGLKNIIGVCEECNMCLIEQIPNILLEADL